jgi:hypothetical protein
MCCAVIGVHALEACGDDSADDHENGGAAGATLPDSVERDKPVSELTEADIGELCAALDAEISKSFSEQDASRLGCTLLAFFTSARPGANGQASVDRAACEQAVQDCLESGDLGGAMTESMCEPTQLQTVGAGCNVSVGEYVDCLSAGAEQLEELLDSLTCETAASGSAPPVGSDPMDISTLPECMAVQSECPGLLAEGGSSQPPSESGCDNTCEDADDGFCDDGGEDSQTSFCGLGTDCIDCGPR